MFGFLHVPVYCIKASEIRLEVIFISVGFLLENIKLYIGHCLGFSAVSGYLQDFF